MEELCKHCGLPISIAGKKEVCSHIYYPERCKVCSGLSMTEMTKDATKTTDDFLERVYFTDLPKE